MSPVTSLPWLVALAIASGCYQPQSDGYSTFPDYASVGGPPGGEIDPAWQQQQYGGYANGYTTGGAGYPEGYPSGYPAGTEDFAAMQSYGELTPSSDPQAAGYVMGATTDAEIGSTLAGYGEWIEVDGYGLVWRPYVSSVGLDFTPYESCGTWVWTDDWGWTFACDWDWGWLPFHYGRWGWFEDYWAWQPGYDWSPGWVEWRGGEEYCGWRPLMPTYTDGYWDSGSWVQTGGGTAPIGTGNGGWVIRDHRGDTGSGGWVVRDHRHKRTVSVRDSDWRFSKQGDFGKRIRPNLFKNPAEGLRVTKIATRPPMKGSRAVPAASIMKPRLVTREAIKQRETQRSRPDVSRNPMQPSRSHDDRRGVPSRSFDDRRPGPSDNGTYGGRATPGGGSAPGYGGRGNPAGSYGGRGNPAGSYGARGTPGNGPGTRPFDPSRGIDAGRGASPVERMWPRPPSSGIGNDRGRPPPSRDLDTPPVRTPATGGWTPPSRGSDHSRPSSPPRDWSRPSAPPPSRGSDYSRPSRGNDYSRPSSPPPSRGSDYSRPSSPPSSNGGSYSAPSRGSSSSGGSWSPPSRGSSSSGGGSYSAPSRGGGGGSYSAPSRGGGGSYSAPSRGGGGSSAPSRGGGGGGRRR